MVKLLLKSKKKKAKNGSTFRTYFTDVNIVVKGEEEKGKQRKSITVKFDKDLKVSNLVRGIITVNDDKDIDLPFKYQVLEKDGKPSYPVIFIRKYDSYEERKGKSTIDFITDEEETADTVIDDEEVEEVEDESEEQ